MVVVFVCHIGIKKPEMLRYSWRKLTIWFAVAIFIALIMIVDIQRDTDKPWRHTTLRRKLMRTETQVRISNHASEIVQEWSAVAR